MLRQEKEIPVEISPTPEVKPIETNVDKAKRELAQAETDIKENKFMPAIYHYMNTMTHAKNAVEEKKLDDNSELFNLLNQAITGLITIATDQNDLFEKCNADTKVILAYSICILCRIENFKKNIPVLESEEKLSPLTQILDNKPLVISLIEKHAEIRRLNNLWTSLVLAKQYDQRKTNELVNYELKKSSAEIINAPTLFKPKQNDLLHSPVKFGLACAIPGAAGYSMINAGLSLVLWGGFYGVIIGTIGCYAANKLEEYCKPKR